MKFKNELERQVYEAAHDVCGPKVAIEHNKVIEIERTTDVEIASFVGPPRKEVDVITAALHPQVTVLISCKQYETAKAQPSVVQEWGAVVLAMNRYSAGRQFLGLIVAPSGFTRGSEPWATSQNIGIIPPLKGRPSVFVPATSIQMTARVLRAISRRLAFPYGELFCAPGFYNFVHDLTSDFEGREKQVADMMGARYSLTGTGWLSSFGELVSTLMGKTIAAVIATTECMGLILGDDLCFLRFGNKLTLGHYSAGYVPGSPIIPVCKKNMVDRPCQFDFLKRMVIGQSLRSAGDFGTYFEFGLSNDINLGFHPDFLRIVRTLNPPGTTPVVAHIIARENYAAGRLKI